MSDGKKAPLAIENRGSKIYGSSRSPGPGPGRGSGFTPMYSTHWSGSERGETVSDSQAAFAEIGLAPDVVGQSHGRATYLDAGALLLAHRGEQCLSEVRPLKRWWIATTSLQWQVGRHRMRTH